MVLEQKLILDTLNTHYLGKYVYKINLSIELKKINE